jgi:hypothetical protein
MAASWPKFVECGPPITDADVSAFEHQFKVSLPQDYRQFLLDVNGGRTSKDSRAFREGTLNGVLSLNADEEHQFNDLASWNERVRHDLGTNDVIVVGYDDGGGRILLGVATEHRGEVWLQLHDERPDGSNPRVLWHDRRDMKKVADTFEAFMQSLKPLQP